MIDKCIICEEPVRQTVFVGIYPDLCDYCFNYIPLPIINLARNIYGAPPIICGDTRLDVKSWLLAPQVVKRRRGTGRSTYVLLESFQSSDHMFPVVNTFIDSNNKFQIKLKSWAGYHSINDIASCHKINSGPVQHDKSWGVDKIVDIDVYKAICPHCGGLAYESFTSVECKNRCQE